MALAEQLAKLKEASKGRMPADKRAIMERATADLRQSGIVGRAIKVGDRLPPFALRNQRDETVQSADILSRGPLVLTVFRGVW